MTIKLSELSGGGGGTPINGIIPINTPDLSYTADDNTVWLRTGFLDTDISSFPDANISVPLPTVFNNGFTTLPDTLNVNDIATDPLTGDIYILDGSSGYVCQVYNSAGVFQGATASLSTESGAGAITGITIENGVLYGIEGSVAGPSVFSFNLDGTFIGTESTAFDVSISSASGLAYDPVIDVFYTARFTSSSLRIYYADQANAIAPSVALVTQSSLSGFGTPGVSLVNGELWGTVYNTSTTTNRIYVWPYLGTNTVNPPLTSKSITDATNEAYYGMVFDTFTNRLLTASRFTDLVLIGDPPAGVGAKYQSSLNDAGETFYYVRVL